MPKLTDENSSAPEGLTLETHQAGPATVISMKGSSLPENMKELEILFSKLRKEGALYYVLDLTHTRLINSHQIGAIVRHVQCIAENKIGGFAFVNPSDRVRYLLEITCASNIAKIYESVDEAVRNLIPSP